MKHVGFDKLDSGEATTLIQTLGFISESQFRQVLPTLVIIEFIIHIAKQYVRLSNCSIAYHYYFELIIILLVGLRH